MFDNIAPTYDKLNHIFSLSIDKVWRRRVVRKVRRMKPLRILDLATGTGDLAIKMAKRIPKARIMGVDLSENMLAVAAEKVRRQGLDDHIALYQGDAENLDLTDGVVDVVTVAFGVRNFGNVDQGLQEIWRVLRSGGHIVVLEFSTPRNFLVRKLYQFSSPEEFLSQLERAGFEQCRRRSQSFGIAQIYIGKKA